MMCLFNVPTFMHLIIKVGNYFLSFYISQQIYIIYIDHVLIDLPSLLDHFCSANYLKNNIANLHAPRQQFTGSLEILLGTILVSLSPVLANSNSQPQLNVCNDAPWWVRAFLSMDLISIFLCLAISNSILPISSLFIAPSRRLWFL